MISFDLTDYKNLSNDKFDTLIRVDNLYFGSKVTSKEQVENIYSLGVKTVIDLKRSDETSFNDKEEFENFGIQYINFPISDLDKIKFADLETLRVILDNLKYPCLMYCMSSNRVGALMALYLCFICGHQKQRAISFGKKIGMKKVSLIKEIENRVFEGSIL